MEFFRSSRPLILSSIISISKLILSLLPVRALASLLAKKKIGEEPHFERIHLFPRGTFLKLFFLHRNRVAQNDGGGDVVGERIVDIVLVVVDWWVRID